MPEKLDKAFETLSTLESRVTVVEEKASTLENPERVNEFVNRVANLDERVERLEAFFSGENSESANGSEVVTENTEVTNETEAPTQHVIS